MEIGRRGWQRLSANTILTAGRQLGDIADDSRFKICRRLSRQANQLFVTVYGSCGRFNFVITAPPHMLM
jgi:hypothetical protein